MILIIQTILLCTFSFGTSLEEKIKSHTVSYLEVFEKAGINKFGERKPVLISDIKKDVLAAQFILVGDDVFSVNNARSRRSAFYEKDRLHPRIFINEQNPPDPDLIIHEVLQDQNYEFAIAMSTLHDKLVEDKSAADSFSVNVYSHSINFLFDSYGLKSKYTEDLNLLSDSPSRLIDFRINNSILKADGGEGGDVSGGGGDQYSFTLKKDILQKVIQKIKIEMKKQFPSESPAKLEARAYKSYIKMLRTICIEIEYGKSSKIEFSITPELSLGLNSSYIMLPRLIKVPRNMDRNVVIEEVSMVILQTMFGFLPSIHKQFFSSCSCSNDRGELVFSQLGCPNGKMHPSTSQSVQTIKAGIEKEYQCKIRFNP
ncbi:hypothetical protein K2X05_06540 [bacterium]|nr:hypothetical protein [bacterium]